MSDKQRPNIVGKGPSLIRELVEILKGTEASLPKLSDDARAKVKPIVVDLAHEIEPITSRAYVKTVKAGETAWDCKEMALELKQAVEAGDEAKAVEIAGNLQNELDGFINKIKTFVVRMT